jgi:hypothetical protein
MKIYSPCSNRSRGCRSIRHCSTEVQGRQGRDQLRAQPIQPGSDLATRPSRHRTWKAAEPEASFRNTRTRHPHRSLFVLPAVQQQQPAAPLPPQPPAAAAGTSSAGSTSTGLQLRLSAQLLLAVQYRGAEGAAREQGGNGERPLGAGQLHCQLKPRSRGCFGLGNWWVYFVELNHLDIGCSLREGVGFCSFFSVQRHPDSNKVARCYLFPMTRAKRSVTSRVRGLYRNDFVVYLHQMC